MNRRLLTVTLALFVAALPMMADVINGGTSVNVNGTLYQDYAGFTVPLSSVPGTNTAAWNPATGLGTFTYTDTGSGARSFDVFVNLDLGTAFWNEYGAAHGTLAPGESFQIDTPDFDCDANRCGTIIANTNSNSLDNLNHVPGQLDNYNFNCGADGVGSVNSACNNDLSLALGFGYTVPTGSQAVLTFTLSNAAPLGGFYLSQTKPTDGDNDPETVYFSGSVAIQPLQAVPEPSSLVLLGIGSVAACVWRKQRFCSAQDSSRPPGRSY